MSEFSWEGEVEVEFTIVARVPFTGYVTAEPGQEEPTEKQLEIAKLSGLSYLNEEYQKKEYLGASDVSQFYDSPEIERFEIRPGTELRHVYVNGRYEIEKEEEHG